MGVKPVDTAIAVSSPARSARHWSGGGAQSTRSCCVPSPLHDTREETLALVRAAKPV